MGKGQNRKRKYALICKLPEQSSASCQRKEKLLVRNQGYILCKIQCCEGGGWQLEKMKILKKKGEQ